jgi:hypothetical protein
VCSKKFQRNVAPLLKVFFETEMKECSGPRPTKLVREVTQVGIRDDDNIEELDPEWTKRRCYARFLWNQGFLYGGDGKGNITITEKTDETWEEPQQTDDEDTVARKDRICSWTTFRDYWKRTYPKLIVRKQSADICGICYQFSIATKSFNQSQKAAYSDSDSDSDGNNQQTLKAFQEREKEVLVLARHMEEAKSMRELAQELTTAGKESAARNDPPGDQVTTVVVDYSQNMEKPFFGRDQPGDTFYFAPKTVNLLGIVDTTTEKDLLHAYTYEEDEGHKGGNNVPALPSMATF